MKNKKILALLLATVMCLSVLTGCGGKDKDTSSEKDGKNDSKESYSETFIGLMDEIGEIESGSVEADVNITISKEMFEPKEDENMDEEISISLDTADMEEVFGDYLDKDGNLSLDVAVDAEYDLDKEEYAITLELLDNDFEIFVDKKDLYIEVGGLFDMVEEFLGEEAGMLSEMFQDYDYIMTTTEDAEEETEEENEEVPSLKDYVTDENVSKDGDKYVLEIDNDYFQDTITDEETLDSLGVKKIKNSSGTMSVEKKDNTYVLEATFDIEEKITIGIDVSLVSESVKIKFPSKDDVLDLNDMDSMFGEIEVAPGVDLETDWDTSDWDDSSFGEDDDNFGWGFVEGDEEDSDWGSYEESDTVEDLEIMYDFNVGTGVLSFILDTDDVTEDNMAEIAGDLTSEMRTAINKASANRKFSENTSSSTGDWPYYMTTFSSTGDFYNESVDYYLTDDYISLSMSFNNIDTSVSKAELSHLSDRIKTLSGVEIPADKLNEWVKYLVESYDGVDDIISARTSYEIENLDLNIYLWDGEEIDISLTVK